MLASSSNFGLSLFMILSVGVRFDQSTFNLLFVNNYRSICLPVCFPGTDNGKSEGYGLRLVRPDIHGQEIKGKDNCWSAVGLNHCHVT